MNLRTAAQILRRQTSSNPGAPLGTLRRAVTSTTILHATTVPRRTMASAVAKRLEGKTILITGASSGIGRSTAFEFARTAPKNLKLVLAARRVDALEQVREELRKEAGDGVRVHAARLDVSKPEEVKNFIPSLPKEFADIDVLVNNA
jgi:3-hydroxy acid dehydrogenase/malonic semialdehyde reductase